MSSPPNVHETRLPATPGDVYAFIANHVDKHRTFPESARLRDLGAEKALVQDYSGRVVFELLQNALDRAVEEVEVRWLPEQRLLEVANDGRAVTVGKDERGRSDLMSLLTLHTSSKTAAESVGNKGVGFRSVFASAPEVEICSRARDTRWWGMRLSHPAHLPDGATDWAAADVASFYAPRPTDADGHERHCTVIRLRDVRNPAVIAESVTELQRGPLTFLERRAAKGLRIRLVAGTHVVTHVLGGDGPEVVEEARVAMSDAVRKTTGLDLPHGEVRVLWRPAPDAESTEESRYWSYLPTEQPAGFGVQVHADFYLSNSRRNLALRRLAEGDSAEDPAGWNARLVDAAADCIARLWRDARVCAAPGFWRVATPAAAECAHLRLAVARRLWADGGALFEEMTRLSFPVGVAAPLGRYRDYFDALLAWADFAFRHQRELGARARYLRVRDLLARAEASGAPVLPIIAGDPNARDTVVRQARPLVQGKQGQRRGRDSDRIYQRRHDADRIVRLPDALRAQRAYVTTFDPRVDGSLGAQGLLPFDRLEILAQLESGGAPTWHAQLIRAALELARQEARGGPGSLLQRVRVSVGGAAWRFVPLSENVQRAGVGLARLHAPSTSGDWVPASTLGTVPGPWPQLDEAALATALGVSLEHGDVADASLLLGITPVPLGTVGTIELPDVLDADTGEALVQEWTRFGAFLDTAAGEPLRGALQSCRWVRGGESLDVRDGLGGESAPHRPVDLWHQQAGRGFTTQLLPRVVLDGPVPPLWLQHLGVRNPSDLANDRTRVLRGIARLRALEPREMLDHQRDLVEVYRALVSTVLKEDDPPVVPLLVRPVDGAGRRLPVRWAHDGEEVWHEPDRANREALQAFRDVLHWVVRKQPAARARALGLRNFTVDSKTVRLRGESDEALTSEMQAALQRAMPDILAASLVAHQDFDPGEALDRFAALSVQHFDDIWIEWTFADRKGEVGEDEPGDVFLRTLEDGRQQLCFDGPSVPLARCAFPLSQLLAGNRAFGSLYKDALFAWTAHAADGGASVERFRREQGLTEREVAEMRDRVEASIMAPEERRAWRAAVEAALAPFGTLVAPPRLGMVVRPDTFTAPVRAKDEDLRQALAHIAQARPRVELHHPNGLRLERADRIPLLAEKAERNRGRWTEASLQAWRQALEHPHPLEDEERRWLGFDALAALRRRLDLPAEPVAVADDAVSFARGQIPLATLPVAPARGLSLRSFSAELGDTRARDAATDDEFIRKARRKAQGGRRAEDAVLTLAVADAMAWRQADPGGFRAALDLALSVLDGPDGNKAERRLEAATTAPGMRKLLHVAEYVGNVGFDVLVPQRDAGCFLLVEVKRVQALSGAAFFLSENERRRAHHYAQKGRPWRLWLVAGSGESLDATAVVEPFAAHATAIGEMAAAGLRPGEWFFALA